jgi:hypothetical protein
MKYLILHLICLTRHPSHARFHLAGIGRDLFVHGESTVGPLLITLAWVALWTAGLLFISI